MELYVAGWDGGGTKTAMQVRNLEGRVLHSATAGGLNYNSNSPQTLMHTVHTLIQEMSRLPGGLAACKMLCVSTAGISNPKAAEFLQQTIREAGLSCDLKIIGDQEGALYGALGKPVGMVLISGTGSICYGRNEAGKIARAGGWGHLIDDEGSGYAIGRDILSAAVQSYDGRIPKSLLYDKVLEQIHGKSAEDIIRFTYSTAAGKKDIAALAPILLEAICEEDQQAIIIARKAASALVQLVLPVARELGLEQRELALTGGILKHYKEIREYVIDQLSESLPKLHITQARYDSVTGVTLLALELIKKEGENTWRIC